MQNPNVGRGNKEFGGRIKNKSNSTFYVSIKKLFNGKKKNDGRRDCMDGRSAPEREGERIEEGKPWVLSKHSQRKLQED